MNEHHVIVRFGSGFSADVQGRALLAFERLLREQGAPGAAQAVVVPAPAALGGGAAPEAGAQDLGRVGDVDGRAGDDEGGAVGLVGCYQAVETGAMAAGGGADLADGQGQTTQAAGHQRAEQRRIDRRQRPRGGRGS